MKRLVLITPARNEAAYIGKTLESVTKQTVTPVRWVIVSDNSTDGTDALVQSYAEKYPWIELVRRSSTQGRSFSSKVEAFNAGWERVKQLQYDIIGNLDGDVSFGPDYFEYILSKFDANPKLGLGGTSFVDPGFEYDYRFTSVEHVAGPCQLFRKECFESIGGYTPVKGGGIDVIAVLTARMKGWETRTFTERSYVHHRRMGTAKTSSFGAKFHDGQKDYSLGSHPLWEICRTLYQMTKKPYFLGGACLIGGYLWCVLAGVKRPVSPEVVAFRRKEQMTRLRQFMGRFGGNRPKTGSSRLSAVSVDQQTS